MDPSEPLQPTAVAGEPLPAPPAAVRQERDGAWGVLATLGLGLAVVVVYTFAQGILMLAALTAAPRTAHQPPMAGGVFPSLSNIGFLFALGTVLAAPLGIGLTLAFARARRGLVVKRYLGLVRPGLRQTLVSVLLLVLFSAAYDALSTLLGRPQVPDFMIDVYRTAGSPLLLALAVVLAAPAFEELLFRGFLLEGLRRSALGGSGAALLTSALFAVTHLQYDLFDMSAVFTLGLLFALVRLRTGSTWLTFGLHALTNLIALLQVAAAVR